jgi:SAM-dependent methyltransferase
LTNKIQYKEFPQKVRNFIESYFSNQLQKVSNQLSLLHISFEERPQNYPSFINAEFISPFKIAYYTDNLRWDGIIHDTTHFFQYHRDTNEYKKNNDIVKTAMLTNFEDYKNNLFEKEAFKVQEAYNNYNLQKLSSDLNAPAIETIRTAKRGDIYLINKGYLIPEYVLIKSITFPYSNEWIRIKGLYSTYLRNLLTGKGNEFERDFNEKDLNKFEYIKSVTEDEIEYVGNVKDFDKQSSLKFSQYTPDDIFYQGSPMFRYGGYPFAYNISTKEVFVGELGKTHRESSEFVNFLGRDNYIKMFDTVDEVRDEENTREFMNRQIEERGYYGRISNNKDSIYFWIPEEEPFDEDTSQVLDCIFNLQQKGFLSKNPKIYFGGESEEFSIERLSTYSSKKLSWQEAPFIESFKSSIYGDIWKTKDTILPFYYGIISIFHQTLDNRIIGHGYLGQYLEDILYGFEHVKSAPISLFAVPIFPEKRYELEYVGNIKNLDKYSSKKLSWREPESLVGWLVKFTQPEGKFKGSEIYGVITNQVGNIYYVHTGAFPDIAIKNPIAHFYNKYEVKFTPIREVSDELHIPKLSWQQPPEDLTGWMVKILNNPDNKTVDNNIVYGVIIHDYFDKVVTRWRRTEESASEAYKDYNNSPYVLSQSLYKKNINIIPLYKVDLNKKASDQDFDFYKDQNSQMYRKRLNYYNENKGAEIFWSSRDAQEKRFEALLDIGDLTDKEILDVGAGYCDLLDYLEKRNIKIKKYVGIDIVPEIVKKARELHPNVNIEIRDIQKDSIEENSFDYVFGSGIFALQSQDWNSYVVDMLKKMLLASKVGVGVNFLKQQEMSRLSWSLKEEDKLVGTIFQDMYGNMFEVLSYIKDSNDVVYKDMNDKWYKKRIDATSLLQCFKDGIFKIRYNKFNINKQSSFTQLKYSNPQEVLNLIKQNVTDKVILKNNYLADDFSIFLMK